MCSLILIRINKLNIISKLMKRVDFLKDFVQNKTDEDEHIVTETEICIKLSFVYFLF